MNKKELAKLLLKHPLIKKINESQMWDKSIVSRTIAEELLAEDKKSAAEMKAAIDLLVKEIGGMKKAIDDLLDERDLRDSLGEDEKSEQAKKAAIELIRKKREKIKELDKLETDYESLSTRAAATPETADDKAVEDAALKDAEELEDAQAELPSPEEVKADPSGKASQISQALDKISTDNVEDAASAIENKPTAEEIQKSYSTIKALLPTLGDKKEPLQSVLVALVSKMSEEDIAEPQEPSAPEGEQKQLPAPKVDLKNIESVSGKIEKIKAEIKWSPADAIRKKLGNLSTDEDKKQFLTNLQDAIKTENINKFVELMNPRGDQDAKFEKAMEFLKRKPDFLEKKMAAIKEKFETTEDSEKAIEYLMIITDVAHAAAEVKEQFGEESETAIALMDKLVTAIVANKTNEQVDAELDLFKQKLGKPSLRSAILKAMGEYIESNPRVREAARAAEIEGLLNNEVFRIWLFFTLEELTSGSFQLAEQVEEKEPIPDDARKVLNPKELADLTKTIKNKNKEIEAFLKNLKSERVGSSGETGATQKQISQQDKEQAMMVLANLKISDEVLLPAAESIGVDPNTVVASLASDEERVKVSDEEVEEAASKAQEEDAKRPSITKEEEYESHIEVFDNFFSLDGANDGFMEQFLLKYQSQKLWQFIGELSKIAMEGEERALSGKPEPSAADAETEEEESTELRSSDDTSAELEEVFNPFKREKEDVVIPKEAKAELKTSLIALLGALKKLRGMTKSYEQNMMKSSANPALDGSSLMAQIQRFLPDIQDSIAKIVERSYESIIEQNRLKDLESKKTEEPQAEEDDLEQEVNELLREVFLEEEAGMSREDKIQIVDAKYQEMRQFYMGGFQEILKAKEQEKAIPAAEKMLEMAREERFISMFPSALVGKSGKPHSVKEAVVVLSDMIQTFVQTMKDVVMLVKKDVIPAATLSSVVLDLTSISDQLEEYFRVDSKIDPELKAKLEKFLAKKPENQSLTDDATGPASEEEREETDELDPPEEAEDTPIQKYIRDKLNKVQGEISKPLSTFVENFAKNVELFYVSELSESVLSKSKNMAKKLWIKMKKEDKKWAAETVEAIAKDLESQKDPILQDKNEFLKILVGSLPKEVEDFVKFFEEMKVSQKLEMKSMLKDIIKRKGNLDLDDPSSIEETLKPIIAKMLKEHHG